MPIAAKTGARKLYRSPAFAGPAPSSPSIGLLRGGQVVWMLERRQIENQGPEQIAGALTAAFEKFCGSPVEA